jgi:hypothetical protein
MESWVQNFAQEAGILWQIFEWNIPDFGIDGQDASVHTISIKKMPSNRSCLALVINLSCVRSNQSQPSHHSSAAITQQVRVTHMVHQVLYFLARLRRDQAHHDDHGNAYWYAKHAR